MARSTAFNTKRVFVPALAAALTLLSLAGTARPARAADHGLARTPPMGWNGYNRYGRDVTAAIVEAEARALVRSGLKADGYRYVNLDGGWDLTQRDSAGQLQPDPAKFPGGIKPVADYVHSLGLKFGIYTSIGNQNCAGTTAGSYGHYAQDARTFASWGVDYVKVDWCDVPVGDFPGQTQEQIARELGGQMRDAIAAAGRPMVFDYNVNGICPDDCQDWTWGPSVASLWRVSRDISDSYPAMERNFEADAPLYGSSGPGGWNDPDMLEAGNGGMTETEYQSMFSLWAEMDAPLIAGNDLAGMTAGTKAILANRRVIAVDQDPLGRQGTPVVAGVNGLWILAKPLADGDRAVVLFNSGDTSQDVRTSTRQAGFAGARSGPAAYELTDLWTGARSQTRGPITAAVPAHAVVMYRIHPSG